MTKAELLNGKTFEYNKFVVGYCQKDKMFYAKKHFSNQWLFSTNRFDYMQEFIEANEAILLT